MRAGALYQSFFSTIWNYSRNGGREREREERERERAKLRES